MKKCVLILSLSLFAACSNDPANNDVGDEDIGPINCGTCAPHICGEPPPAECACGPCADGEVAGALVCTAGCFERADMGASADVASGDAGTD